MQKHVAWRCTQGLAPGRKDEKELRDDSEEQRNENMNLHVLENHASITQELL